MRIMSGSLTDGPWSLVDGLMGTHRTPCLIEGQFINCPNPVKGEETASHARAGGGGGWILARGEKFEFLVDSVRVCRRYHRRLFRFPIMSSHMNPLQKSCCDHRRN